MVNKFNLLLRIKKNVHLVIHFLDLISLSLSLSLIIIISRLWKVLIIINQVQMPDEDRTHPLINVRLFNFVENGGFFFFFLFVFGATPPTLAQLEL